MIIREADLCICLGTSLQIFPCANLPVLTKKNAGRIAVVNLQATRLHRRADLVVHERVDVVMNKVFSCFTFISVAVIDPLPNLDTHRMWQNSVSRSLKWSEIVPWPSVTNSCQNVVQFLTLIMTKPDRYFICDLFIVEFHVEVVLRR